MNEDTIPLNYHGNVFHYRYPQSVYHASTHSVKHNMKSVGNQEEQMHGHVYTRECIILTFVRHCLDIALLHVLIQ